MDEQELYNQISQVVDQWVSEVLKSRFIEKPHGQQPRSLWDKFKQGVTNWWWGPKGDKYNPYRWRNRFGNELGVSESFNPSVFTLHEYKDIRGLVDSVESTLNESEEEFDKLRLMKIVRSAAERLKEMLFSVLKGRNLGPDPQANRDMGTKSKSSATDHMDVDAHNRPLPDEPEVDLDDREDEPAGYVPPEARGEDSSSKSARVKVGRGAAVTPPSKPVVAKEKKDDGKGEAKKPNKTDPAGPVASVVDKSDGSKKPTTIDSAGSNAAVVDKSDGSKKQADPRPQDKEKEEIKKVKESFRLVSNMSEKQKKSLSPNKDWLANGKIKRTMIPDLIVWMSDKTDSPLDYKAIQKELKSAFGSDVEVEVPGEGDDRIEKYLKGVFGSELESAIRALNTQEESEGLRAYLYSGDYAYDKRSSLRLIQGFLIELDKSIPEERAQKIRSWWSEEKKLVLGDSESAGRAHLYSNLVGSESYVEKISDLSGISKKQINEKMIDHIRSLSKTRAD